MSKRRITACNWTSLFNSLIQLDKAFFVQFNRTTANRFAFFYFLYIEFGLFVGFFGLMRTIQCFCVRWRWWRGKYTYTEVFSAELIIFWCCSKLLLLLLFVFTLRLLTCFVLCEWSGNTKCTCHLMLFAEHEPLNWNNIELKWFFFSKKKRNKMTAHTSYNLKYMHWLMNADEGYDVYHLLCAEWCNFKKKWSLWEMKKWKTELELRWCDRYEFASPQKVFANPKLCD